jgi:DNA-binding transcriptional MerR regulator
MTKVKQEWHDDIIKMHIEKHPHRVIGEKYGVSQSTIGRVLNSYGYYGQIDNPICFDEISAYAEQGLTVRQIADRTGIEYYRIDQFVRRHSIPIKRNKKFSSEEVEKLYEYSGIMPVNLIAKKLRCNKYTVRKKMANMGLSSKVELDNFTLKQVAELTGVNYQTLRYWLRKGQLKSRKSCHARGNHAIPRQEVLRILQEKGSLTRELELFLS